MKYKLEDIFHCRRDFAVCPE